MTFEVPDDLADEFEFVPGQSLTLRRMVDGVEQRRQYSISAPAGGRPRVGVREIPDGLFSRWLVRDVRAGDEIDVQTPSGRFCPDPALLEGGRHLCIAAGSGITPMLSVASSVLENDGDVTLLYGNRTTGSVMFAEELADLKNRYGPQLQLVHVLSREPRDVELFSGRLDADRLRRLLTTLVPAARFDHVWLCGPHAMLLDAQEVLAELGVPRDRVHFELFYVDEPPPELHRAEAEVVGRDHGGDRRARRPHHDVRTPTRAEHPRRRAVDALRPPVRVQGRRVRHLPGQGHRRRGGHAPQLRARAGRGRGRLRAHLPEPSGRRRRHRGLRRMTDPLDTARQMWADDPASRALGMELRDLGPGHAVVAMTVRADMVNGHAVAHGGLVAALADSAFALACNSRGTPTVAAGFDVSFLEPAHDGDVLVATAEERALRGRSGIYDVTVRRDDTVIAEFRGRSRALR